MAVVIDWILEAGNYGKWKGSDENNGESKETLCTQIRSRLEEKGIHHRTNRDIRNRIQYIQEKYRLVND